MPPKTGRGSGPITAAHIEASKARRRAAVTITQATKDGAAAAEIAEAQALDRAFPGRLAARLQIHRDLAAEYFPAPQSPPPPLTASQQLAAAVELLVSQHGCGPVIDECWAASKRLFKPLKEQRR